MCGSKALSAPATLCIGDGRVEYQQALERGYFASDQRMNLGNEGTVFPGQDGDVLLAKGRAARIVRFKYDPEIMYYDKADEYIKTGSHYVDTGEGGYNRMKSTR